MNPAPPAVTSNLHAQVLEHLLGLALQPSLSGFEQSLKGLLRLFELSAWACLFPPSFSSGGRFLFVTHATRTSSPLLQRAAREGWEKSMPNPGDAAKVLNELATELAPQPGARWRVIQLTRGRQAGFTFFVYRPPGMDFANPELEMLAQVGRQIDRCFVALARQQEQEFVGGLFKMVCDDIHPDGLCVLDQRRRPILENKLFRTHMLIWEQGANAATQMNLPKQTRLPPVWQQACEEAFAAYQQSQASPSVRLVVSQGPLVYLEQRVTPSETLEGSVRYLAFQNSLGVIPYLLLTSSLKRTQAKRSASLDRLAEQFGLSPRELDVARMVADGASAAEIVERLKVALPTVKTHIRNLLRKTGVKTRLQFVSLCHR